MALLDLPGSILSSPCPTLPISANSGRGPWAGASFLVVGPAGSGKLSLVRAISLACNPRTRLVLLDFETESQAQRALLDHLSARLADDEAMAAEQSGETIVFRHIHRLSEELLAELVTICRGFSQRPDRRQVVFHATGHSLAEYPKSLRNELRSFFNCLIQWSGFPRTETRIRQFVADVIADLNRRHGQHILGVDPPVVDFVHRISLRANLYELRNVIERAYFREASSHLSVEAMAAACPSACTVELPHHHKGPGRPRRTVTRQFERGAQRDGVLAGSRRKRGTRPRQVAPDIIEVPSNDRLEPAAAGQFPPSDLRLPGSGPGRQSRTHQSEIKPLREEITLAMKGD